MQRSKIYQNINKVVKSIQRRPWLGVLTLFILGTIYMYGSSVEPVHAAEQTFRVSPVIINITLSPGKTYTKEVTIENLTSAPMPLRASLADFVTGGEEGGYVFETKKANPLLSWIDLSEKEFILNAGEKKTIVMDINTPKSIPVGGYYGMLFFEPVLQNGARDATSINSKIGVLMLANIGVPDPNAQKANIVTFQPALFSESGILPVLLRVQNISLNFFTAKAEVFLEPMIPFFDKTKSVQLEDKIIFPGQIRRWEDPTAIQDIGANIYKVTLKVSSGNGQVIETSRIFFVFPFIKILLITAVLAIIIYCFIKQDQFRKTIKRFFHS